MNSRVTRLSRRAGNPELLPERLHALGDLGEPALECGRPDMCNGDQPEVVACQDTGMRQCTAVWRRGETVIDVTTWGMSPPMVERVECRAGCR